MNTRSAIKIVIAGIHERPIYICRLSVAANMAKSPSIPKYSSILAGESQVKWLVGMGDS